MENSVKILIFSRTDTHQPAKLLSPRRLHLFLLNISREAGTKIREKWPFSLSSSLLYSLDAAWRHSSFRLLLLLLILFRLVLCSSSTPTSDSVLHVRRGQSDSDPIKPGTRIRPGGWLKLRGRVHSPLRSFAVKAEKIQTQKKKKRLDEICLDRYQQYSRTLIQSWILQGKVTVDGRVVNKAGTPVSDKANVEIIAEIPKYVCRAGYKLEAAIEQLGVDVEGKVALDSGLSTGGFTDCLLQYGASFVYGVDVGYGQVADKIRRDERVSVIERTNLRYLTELPQKVDLVTLDLSFISILLVMPAVVNVMKDDATLVTLVKPQFEARRSQVGGGGIVRDPQVHKEVLERIITGVENFGFSNKGWIESPLKGAEGNTEFLVCFNRVSARKPE